MPSVASVPATYNNFSQAATFAIPAGVWVSAFWTVNGNGATAGNNFVQTSPTGSSQTAIHGAGAVTNLIITALAPSLGDINARAGLSLTTLLYDDNPINVTSHVLTLVAGSTVVHIVGLQSLSINLGIP